jgi:plastocyanin
MTGQQLFANGTGLAYFDDGTTTRFSHTITATEGYYYDNSTAFYIGEIPGINNTSPDNGVRCGENATTLDSGTSNDVVNITIIRGASLVENKSRVFEPSPVISIKVGDTVTWINEDISVRWIASPPLSMSAGGEIPFADTFSSMIGQNGGTFSCTFTEPGGFHYVDGFDFEMKGAIIVMER